MKSKRNLFIVIFLCVVVGLFAQHEGDSLSMTSVLSKVIEAYPALLKADNDIKSADQKISLSKSAYLPEVLLNASASLLGPVNSITMPGLGSVNLYPNYNYNASVSISQNVYDFGRTEKNVSVDEQSREIVRLSSEQLKQRLINATATVFYSLCYMQQAVEIRQNQLMNLNEHLSFVLKRLSTGSATNFDVITTKVRISNTENLITDLQAVLQTLRGQLNTLLGNKINASVRVKSELSEIAVVLASDSLYNKAFANRNEIQMALQKEKLYQLCVEQIETQDNPSLNAFASGGIKNGYLNNHFQDIGRLNYVVGLSVKVPLYDANRTKRLKNQVQTELEGLKQETELARRSVSSELNECIVNTFAASSKVKRSELQVAQAIQAYQLANVNYQSGAITNLELLDSYNALSESKLILFKTKIDYALSLQRLRIAVGEKMY